MGWVSRRALAPAFLQSVHDVVAIVMILVLNWTTNLNNFMTSHEILVAEAAFYRSVHLSRFVDLTLLFVSVEWLIALLLDIPAAACATHYRQDN